MTTSHAALETSTASFAVWARRAHLPLPYPLDISTVRGVGVEPADAETPALARLARILAGPRASAFALRAHPDGTDDYFLAVAGEHDAALVTMNRQTTTVAGVDESRLAVSVVNALPQVPKVNLPVREVAEADWNALFAMTQAEPAPDDLRERFADAGLVPSLVGPMLAAAAEPVVVGVLGAAAWTDGQQRLGPRVSGWYEYPRGGVLIERVPPRGRGVPVVRVGALNEESAFRALAGAVADAVNAAAAQPPGKDAVEDAPHHQLG